MNYPTRPQSPNGYQILGNLISQGGQIAGQFGEAQAAEADRQNRLQLLMQDAAEKRAAAQMLKIKAEREAAEEARKVAESEKMKTAVTDFQTFAKGGDQVVQAARSEPYLAPGMGPNGEAAMQIPAVTQFVRPDRAAMQQRALESGAYADPGIKAYMDDTNPAKTLEGQKELFGIKADAQAKASAERMKYQAAMEEYRQGRTDARTVMTLKAAMDRAEMNDKSKPKTDSGMPVKALGDTELKTIKDIQNTAYSIAKIREAANSISSLKKGPIVGRALRRNPYDTELQSLERLVKQTVPGMARGVFGEVGVLTDNDVQRYSEMLAGVKEDPALATKIMDDLEAKIASAYQNTVGTYQQGGRDVSGFDPSLDFAGIVRGTRPSSPGRAPALDAVIDASANGASPKIGTVKTNSKGRQVVYTSQGWKAK